MPDEVIRIEGSNRYAVISSPIVVVPNAITFTQDGKVVAQVEATYNIEGLPTELHPLFLQLVNQSCHNLILPSARDVYNIPPPPAQKRKPWYQRLRLWVIKLFRGNRDQVQTKDSAD